MNNNNSTYREPLYPPSGYLGPARYDDDDDDDDDGGDDGGEQQYTYYPPVFASPIVTDRHLLSQRQKQIDLGKNTIGYQNYINSVPRHERRYYNSIHPMTPDIYDATLSKRNFDGRVRAWRRQLHYWDVLPGQPLPLDPKPYVPHHIRKAANMAKQAEKRQRMKLDSASVNRDDGGGKGLFDDFDL